MVLTLGRTQRLINLCNADDHLRNDQVIAAAIAAKKGEQIEARLRQLAAIQRWDAATRISEAAKAPGLLTAADQAAFALSMLSVQN